MQYNGTTFEILKKLLAESPRQTDYCWIWPMGRNGASVNAYGTVTIPADLRVNGKRTELVHRVAYKLENGNIPDGLCVLHRCDNPGCFRPSHMFLGTKQDNVDDCFAKGRANKPRGTQNGNAKLTEANIREIRAAYPAISGPKLARSYGVSQAAISKIVRREWWRHVS